MSSEGVIGLQVEVLKQRRIPPVMSEIAVFSAVGQKSTRPRSASVGKLIERLAIRQTCC